MQTIRTVAPVGLEEIEMITIIDILLNPIRTSNTGCSIQKLCSRLFRNVKVRVDNLHYELGEDDVRVRLAYQEVLQHSLSLSTRTYSSASATSSLSPFATTVLGDPKASPS